MGRSFMVDAKSNSNLIKNDFDLNKVFNPKFLELLKENFEDKNIYVGHLAIFLINQGVDFTDEDAEAGELIRVFKKSVDDIVNDDINIVSTDNNVLITFNEILDKL